MAIKSNKSVFWVNFVLKFIFVAILLFYLYRDLIANNDLVESWNHFLAQMQQGSIIYLFICLALMPVNWSVESIKWRLLVQPFEPMTFFRSFQAVLSGISIALLTPNRIGEYGGRMIMVEAKNNWKAVISTLISSYAQNIWNVGLGLIAAMIFAKQYYSLESYLFITGLIVSTLFLVLLIIIYFNIDLIHRLMKKWSHLKWIGKALKHLQLLKNYQIKTLSTVLLWALLRYLVYLSQYVLILHFFGLEMGWVNAAIGIATIFLIQTSIPLPPIIGFLARGEIALLIWGGTAFNDLSILASSYLLWLLNLIIPSIFGALVVLTSNLSRTFGFNRNYF